MRDPKETRVYMAGPLCTASERAWIEQVDALVQSFGFATFLPHRDAGLVSGNPEDIYRHDVDELERCTLMVANLDGADVDSGTAVEIGWFASRGKPVIGIRTDRRGFELGTRVNLMVECSTWSIARDLEGLARHLRGWLEQPAPCTCTPATVVSLLNPCPLHRKGSPRG